MLFRECLLHQFLQFLILLECLLVEELIFLHIRRCLLHIFNERHRGFFDLLLRFKHLLHQVFVLEREPLTLSDFIKERVYQPGGFRLFVKEFLNAVLFRLLFCGNFVIHFGERREAERICQRFANIRSRYIIGIKCLHVIGKRFTGKHANRVYIPSIRNKHGLLRGQRFPLL